MDWLTPTRRAALERLGGIQRPGAPPPPRAAIYEPRDAWSFTFSERGRRIALGPAAAPPIHTLFKPDWLTERRMIDHTTSAERHFGRLRRLDLSSLWDDGDSFVTWLGLPETLAALQEVLGLDLAPHAVDAATGETSIVAQDGATARRLVIGGAPSPAEPRHLAALLASAAEVDASVVVWVAAAFSGEQRHSLAWLDAVTGSSTRFVGLILEMWCIDDSQPAPRFIAV